MDYSLDNYKVGLFCSRVINEDRSKDTNLGEESPGGSANNALVVDTSRFNLDLTIEASVKRRVTK